MSSDDMRMPKATCDQAKMKTSASPFSSTVSLDPDNILSGNIKNSFSAVLQQYDSVFDPAYKGYNGAFGNFTAVVNMGSVQPPQRKGRVPQYSRNKLVELQTMFDSLEVAGVFKRPEDAGVVVEYLNPSFLVRKPNGGHRLVTAFADVGRYCKPSPSMMPDVDGTLRIIGSWKYIAVTDLTSAFYQIPLSEASMKYCGVVTPFKGVRVYTRSAMGMPGSETALEELMCRILGPLLQEGIVCKLADDLYCGGSTPEELLSSLSRVLEALEKGNLKLSAHKTVICPKSTSVLGWIWSQGTIVASPHRISSLCQAQPPGTVRGLRSFIGAYKILSRVLPGCSAIISPLDDAIAGLESHTKIVWTDDLRHKFAHAQQSLQRNRSITLPCPSDKLWIITDGSVKSHGVGSTLYVTRNSHVHLAGFFSAKLKKHQVTWLPCEVEALGIAAAVKHFCPFIIQSKHQTCVLTDSKPCVQALEKLCRGEFSHSPRVSTFLATVSRYQVSVLHLAGSVNIPSDFASRNAPECSNPSCQICSFISETEESVVRGVCVKDIVEGRVSAPFANRPAWITLQSDCSDLRRVHAHLRQGTRPSKKLTNVKDVKRYLNVATVSHGGLLVVKKHVPLAPSKELIIVPRHVLSGLLTALHMKFDHPSSHQLKLVVSRHFYALDMDASVLNTTNNCYTCSSLKKAPNFVVAQSSEDPPESVGTSFAADVLRRNRQIVLVLRETVTSYTRTQLLADEKHDTLRSALICLCLELRPLDGPKAVIRVDPAPGFIALYNDKSLANQHISIEVGRVKNPNKNPVAERAVQEVEEELLKSTQDNQFVTPVLLATATARLNSRIRSRGLSAREMFMQRDQFSNMQLPLSDVALVEEQHRLRDTNHQYSEKSQAPEGFPSVAQQLQPGDLVYLYTDKSKIHARDRYMVSSVQDDWCYVKKFAGPQLRSNSYKGKLTDCFLVPFHKFERTSTASFNHDSDTEESHFDKDSELQQPTTPNIPSVLTSPVEPVAPDVHQTDCPTTCLPDPEVCERDCNNPPILPESPNSQSSEHDRPHRKKKPPAWMLSDDWVTS